MIYLLSLIIGMFNPNEINMANSLDWLCYHSGTIATVKITSVKEEQSRLMDYESDATVYATITKQFKGTEPLNKNIIIYSRLAYIGSDKWKNMMKKEVLVFLKDMVCEKQCVYSIWDDDRGMINLESPGEKALTGDFRVLNNKEDIYTYGMAGIEKLKGKKAEPYYLEVPKDTEAHGALYAGSSCFLIVPDILYPESTRGMH